MELKEKLEIFKKKGYTYDPETGNIISRFGNIIKGKGKGYIVLVTEINTISYRVRGHQLAWYLYYNDIPSIIDHKDRNRSNNKIENLRCVTNQENHYNQGAKGYYKPKGRNNFTARIKHNGKTIHIGCFKTEIEARTAYLNAKKLYYKYEE